MPERCKTRLLCDDPVEDDYFGSHEGVATAMASLIREEQGGKSIALTGNWGAGKSSVVRMLKTELSRYEKETASLKFRTFVYDAWAHQGDPLRRSFLEALIRFTIRQDWCEEEKWKKKLEALAKRQEDKDITSTPRLTGAGVLVAATLLLVPLGHVLVQLKHTKTGVLLSVLPLLVLLVIYWRTRDWKQLKTGGEDGSRNLSILKTLKFWTDRASSVLGLLVSQSQVTTESTTYHTPDPTSLEFAATFQALLEEALLERPSDGDRHILVVVIDNLDRVSPSDAVKIWATMRTFFDDDSASGAARPWLKNLWLVVPCDPDALSRLWTGSEGVKETASAFIHKTFQCTFQVAPPILSDLHGFMREQLRLAMPEHSPEADFEAVYHIYRIKAPSTRPVTPREVKIFVNAVGALHRQWCGKIQLPFLAAYQF